MSDDKIYGTNKQTTPFEKFKSPSRSLAGNLISILFSPVSGRCVGARVTSFSLLLCIALIFLSRLFSISCRHVCLLCCLGDDVSVRNGGVRRAGSGVTTRHA